MDWQDVWIGLVCLVLVIVAAGLFLGTMITQIQILRGPAFVGPKGLVGPAGGQGETGPTSQIPGSTGPTGPIGPNSTGPTGPQGPNGVITGPPGTFTDQIMRVLSSAPSTAPSTGAVVAASGGISTQGNLNIALDLVGLSNVLVDGGIGAGGFNVSGPLFNITSTAGMSGASGAALIAENGGLSVFGDMNINTLLLSDGGASAQTGGFTFGYANPQFVMLGSTQPMGGVPYIWDTPIASFGTAIQYDSDSGIFTLNAPGRYQVSWNLDFAGAMTPLVGVNSYGIASFAPTINGPGTRKYGLTANPYDGPTPGSRLSANTTMWVTASQLPGTFYIATQLVVPPTTNNNVDPTLNTILVEFLSRDF